MNTLALFLPALFIGAVALVKKVPFNYFLMFSTLALAVYGYLSGFAIPFLIQAIVGVVAFVLLAGFLGLKLKTNVYKFTVILLCLTPWPFMRPLSALVMGVAIIVFMFVVLTAKSINRRRVGQKIKFAGIVKGEVVNFNDILVGALILGLFAEAVL